MKLFDVPRNTWIKLGDMPLFFVKIDGMYSICETTLGETTHLAAWTEVTILDEAPNEKQTP